VPEELIWPFFLTWTHFSYLLLRYWVERVFLNTVIRQALRGMLMALNMVPLTA